MKSCSMSLPKSAKFFFVDGPGGTGKTFLYKALLAKVHSKGLIAIATATSSISFVEVRFTEDGIFSSHFEEQRK